MWSLFYQLNSPNWIETWDTVQFQNGAETIALIIFSRYSRQVTSYVRQVTVYVKTSNNGLLSRRIALLVNLSQCKKNKYYSLKKTTAYFSKASAYFSKASRCCFIFWYKILTKEIAFNREMLLYKYSATVRFYLIWSSVLMIWIKTVSLKCYWKY